MSKNISRCLLCEALLKDTTSLQLHLTDQHQVLSVEGLYLLTHTDVSPPSHELPTAPIVRCPLCEALLKAQIIKRHFTEHHLVISDRQNSLSTKCYGLLMRAKPYQYTFPFVSTGTPEHRNTDDNSNSRSPQPTKDSPVPQNVEHDSPRQDVDVQQEDMEMERVEISQTKEPGEITPVRNASPQDKSPQYNNEERSQLSQQIIKEEVLDNGGGSSDDEQQPQPMQTNQDITPNFKSKSWLTEPTLPSSIAQSYRVVPNVMYRSFLYNPALNPAPAPPQAVHPPPVPQTRTPAPVTTNAEVFVENTPQSSITFYEGQSFANFQQFKVLWDRYLSDTQTMVQKRSSKTGHDATYFPYKHVLYVCFYYGKGRSASWRDMEDAKAANSRKCRFKLRLHFDTKVGRYRITKYNGSHSNHQLGKIQRQSYTRAHPSQLLTSSQTTQKRGDELLKAHSILRTHPLSSLSQLQHQSLGQDILFWQSGSMKEIAEANPRLLSLSTLYPVAKEDFVLHLFYAHKDKEKYLVAWTFINYAVHRSAEIALTIFARFNPVTQKQAELVVMNHSIEWVTSAINIFCKAIFHLSLESVHEHLTKRLNSSCDWERVENGEQKHKLCLDILERVVYAKNETDYAMSLKELELAGPATFMEYFYNNWNNKKDFWVFYIQQRTAEALKSTHLEKQESKIENFLKINRKSLTSCISLLMLFGEAPERLNAHLGLLDSHQEANKEDIKPDIIHQNEEQNYSPTTTTQAYPSNSPSYPNNQYPNEYFTKSGERDGENKTSSPIKEEDKEPSRTYSGDSYEEGSRTPNQETSACNAEYSPEYGVSEDKVQFNEWKNGEFIGDSRESPKEPNSPHEHEPSQEASGSDDESSPNRTGAPYPPFNSNLFPHQFLPRHAFVHPSVSLPSNYVHPSASREFPPLTRGVFTPSASSRDDSNDGVVINASEERQ